MRPSHRGHHEPDAEKDYGKLTISLDYHFAMSHLVGEANGFTEAELESLTPELENLEQQRRDRQAAGDPGFFILPADNSIVQEIRGLAKKYKEWCRDLLVLGSGSPALGIQALREALCHPSHNYFPIGRRQYHSRLFVADSLDPDSLYGLLDDLELKRLLVNVIFPAGGTTATLATFLFINQLLQGRLGPLQARESFIFTTSPDAGDLRGWTETEGFAGLSLPAGLAGHFSLFSAAGLFPAAMAGIDISGLLAGARFMDQRLKTAAVSQNPAYCLAACYYLAATRKGRALQVFLPGAASLRGVAQWVCQIWTESLGKKPGGEASSASGVPTPIPGAGLGAQQSLLQSLLQGPDDKFVTFLEVEKFKHHLTIPATAPAHEGLHFLAHHGLAEVLAAEQRAAAFHLMRAGRPSLTIKLPEINAFTLGQLLHLFQATIIALGGLCRIDPFEQTGSAGVQETIQGLLGRPGYESQRQEMAQAAALAEKKFVL